jgi:hypothetical protein
MNSEVAMDIRNAEEDKALLARMHEVDKRAAVLMTADPRLPFSSAFVIASDMISGEENLARLRDGTLTYNRALVFTGSYGRLSLVLAADDEHLVIRNQTLDALVEYWSGSDPDDTDERYLRLWYQAWERNHNKPVTDGAVLPRRQRLRVYRGQDLDAPLGCAWSLDRKTAEKFANGAATRQAHRNGVVIEGWVKTVDVLAYLNERGEREVILDPETVEVER